jgi:adenosylmethionine-8-amino-7-oxononanoate aminotransferase
MKDDGTFIPLEVVVARGRCMELKVGRRIIDALSSGWCKSLGHHHPALKRALFEQIERNLVADFSFQYFRHFMRGWRLDCSRSELA